MRYIMSEYCNNVRNLTISEVVKFIRDTRHLSLERLGGYFQVSKADVWQWENGNVEPRKSIKERLYSYAEYIQKDIAESQTNNTDTKHTDEVHNPEHYKLNGLNIEVVDVIKAVLTDEEFKGWCKGNALKYLMRAGKKDKSKEKQDFAKAGVFISWLTD